ncbi:MAG: replicative DNA helicase [Thermoanaerobaculia bacterium]|nr:replicative DNA helicase [Thermoanaerobaculia bacterium]
MIEALQQQKSLPHSEESERAVLAGVMLDPEQLAVISGRLRAEDFYHERHRKIFQAMIDVQAAESEIDLRTVQARLEQKNELEAIGGLAYLASLDLDLPDLGRLESYVEIVKERAIRRRLIDACAEITRNCLDGGLDAAEALGRAEQSILELGELAIRRGFVPLSTVFEQTLEDLEERPAQGFIGLATGFVDFDDKTRGLNKGNLIIVAGRPGMGKTSFALNIAQHAAIREEAPVGIFSLEMSQSELALRILSSETSIAFGPLRSGHLSNKNWATLIQKVKQISGAPIYIDDSANPTLLELASRARRLKAEHDLELIIVDYLQLMEAGGRYENRNLEISAITRGLKQLAKELDIPVVALSQLSRQPERRGKDHRPQLADLRESGSIEQDADLVAFIYRDEVYNPDDPTNRGLAELIIAKHRNGETGRIPLVFLGETTTFKSQARQDASAPPF